MKGTEHQLSIEKREGKYWTESRSLCSCGFIGPWRHSGQYVPVDEHGHDHRAHATQPQRNESSEPEGKQ